MHSVFFCRAEFTKEIVTPALGVSGVGGAMAVYGAFDAIVSMRLEKSAISYNEQLGNLCIPKESFGHGVFRTVLNTLTITKLYLQPIDLL